MGSEYVLSADFAPVAALREARRALVVTGAGLTGLAGSFGCVQA